MLSHINPGDAVQALDIQLATAPLNGTAIADGVMPTRTGPLETSITNGTAFVDGDVVAVGSDTVAHDPGDNLPRRDVLYVDSSGTVHIAQGDPNEALGPEGMLFEDFPFRFWSPSPPPLSDINGTPIAEIAIPQAAIDYDENDHFRDIRPTTDVILDGLNAYRELQTPVFDELDEIDESPQNLVQITGDGADDRGLYNYFDSVGWERIGAQTTLSDIAIETDKDWRGYSLSNIGALETSSLSVSDGHGDINRLPMIRYGQNTTEEIARISLDDDQVLEIGYLEVKMKGGGTNSSFTIDYYDETAGEVIVETSDRYRASGTNNAVSSPGADVIMRYSNETGDVAHVSINEITRIVDADEV